MLSQSDALQVLECGRSVRDLEELTCSIPLSVACEGYPQEVVVSPVVEFEALEQAEGVGILLCFEQLVRAESFAKGASGWMRCKVASAALPSVVFTP